MKLGPIHRAFARTYLTIDGRSLALCRVVLASVLMVDLARRVPWLRDFYSNQGLLPNHMVLWRPTAPRLVSLLFSVSLPEEAAVVFALAFGCFFCLLIGWRTRLVHVLSFVMTVSLHNRVLFAENGSTVALAALMLWTSFLPLGRRFSVDALLASLRAGRDERPEDLSAQQLPPADTRPAVSLAVLGVLLQLAVIYGFNCLHKTGHAWRDGTSVHYLLYQERIVTWLGVWTREHMPFAFTAALTYGTLVIEGTAPALLLSPVFSRYTRLLAIVVLSGLHLGIALLVNLGIFSAAMMAYYPLLIDGSLWDWLAKRRRRAQPELLAFYDAGCGVCFQVARLATRLDPFRRVRWVPNRDRTALPADVDTALLDQTLLVIHAATGRRWTRADACARVAGALPFGGLGAWVLRMPGLRTLAGRAYDTFAAHRASVSAWLGLAACGLPGSAPPAPAFAGESARSPAAREARQALAVLRELAVATALVVLGVDTLVGNQGVPESLRWRSRPEWMVNAQLYPRIFEGWGLFAPEGPYDDEMVVVDAVTADGRHVDPYNEVGSRVHDLPVDEIPTRLGQDSWFCDYSFRIPGEGSYHDALRDWILRYPERTHRKEDTIVSFEAIRIQQRSPAPGQTEPTSVRHQVFLKWPAR